MNKKTSKECKVTDMGSIAQSLLSAGLDPKSIPLLHSQTACDSTSYLNRIGQSIAWSTFKDSHELLKNINCDAPNDIDYERVEKFRCCLYL